MKKKGEKDENCSLKGAEKCKGEGAENAVKLSAQRRRVREGEEGASGAA